MPMLSLVLRWFPGCLVDFRMRVEAFDDIAGGEDTVVQKLDRQGLMGPRTPLLENSAGIRALVQHPVPLKWCMDPWELGRPFYNAAKFGIVQYVSPSCIFPPKYW